MEVSDFPVLVPHPWQDPDPLAPKLPIHHEGCRCPSGHIPGAVNIPFATVSSQWVYLEGYGPKIVYGNGYNDPLADAMSKTLMEFGLKDIYTLRGGLEAWVETGQDLAKGAPPSLENQKPPRRRPIRH